MTLSTLSAVVVVRQDYHESEKFTRGTQYGRRSITESHRPNQIIVEMPAGLSLGRAVCLSLDYRPIGNAQVPARARGEGPPARVPRAARAFIDEQQVRKHVRAHIGPCACLTSVA